MQVKVNCPNCGAAIKHIYNHNCEYCGTMLDFNIHKVEEINPKYLKNIKLDHLYVENNPKFPVEKIILIFNGQYSKVAEALEFTNTNTYICIDADCLVPKNVSFSIAISIDAWLQFLESGRKDFLQSVLPFELDDSEFIKALNEFYKIYHRGGIR